MVRRIGQWSFRGVWLAALLALAAGCATQPGGAAGELPKNIIILFADGTAPTQWEFGKYTARQFRNRDFAVTDIVMRDGALGLLSTHSLDSFVTDSAAAALSLIHI